MKESRRVHASSNFRLRMLHLLQVSVGIQIADFKDFRKLIQENAPRKPVNQASSKSRVCLRYSDCDILLRRNSRRCKEMDGNEAGIVEC